MLAEEAKQKKAELYKPSRGVKNLADLPDSSQWALGDVVDYGRIMKTVERDIVELKELRSGHKKAIRDLERTALRSAIFILTFWPSFLLTSVMNS